MNKVDEFNAADALIGMAIPNKEEEELHGLYDKRRNVKFPVKLMQILDDENYQHIISWTPDGKAFAVLKPIVLEQKVLPAVFDNKQNGTSKFKSFLRKLYRWGFLKKFHQSDDYTYYHKAFQRGNLPLCLTITRLPNVKKPTATKSNSNSIETNVHASALGGPPSQNNAYSDAAIINALKQKVLLNELTKAAALKVASKKSSNPDDTESAIAAAAALGAVGNTASSLQTLQALQLSALASNNNVNALSSLGLTDRFVHNNAAAFQQSALINDFLLSGSWGGVNNLNTNGLLGGASGSSLLNPASALMQSRINPLDNIGTSSLLGAGGLGPQSYTNDALLSTLAGAGSGLGNLNAMDEATKNLILASLTGVAPGLPPPYAVSAGAPVAIQSPTTRQSSPTPASLQQLQKQKSSLPEALSPSSSSVPGGSSSQVSGPAVGGPAVGGPAAGTGVVDSSGGPKSNRITNTHTQIMSGALNDLMKRQKILETLEANLTQVGQVQNLGGGSNMFHGM